ncbi:hypothetical protein K493DRAFT_317768 [Basidiobolus meristosporus CBS 931.73]|uniref:Uncharacterized protein n=1 Tax=Basidiobolus meristosporus CBS 931.73 TaxID=1314790 RepID=A0A1Y1XYA5_9FUNG|nr:hypothetical protein K493DRAFT_317768 [Basidiobolus meristosporus CBS 931.73]|eukprot:ORX90721.1 hypothetical protein K493DRAFT_317768 [Basidiobolus meristosporus CBS 931.73]
MISKSLLLALFGAIAVQAQSIPLDQIRLDIATFAETNFEDYLENPDNVPHGGCAPLTKGPIKSYAVAAVTKVELYEGDNCSGDILYTTQGGARSIEGGVAAKSVKLYFNRTGSN